MLATEIRFSLHDGTVINLSDSQAEALYVELWSLVGTEPGALPARRASCRPASGSVRGGAIRSTSARAMQWRARCRRSTALSGAMRPIAQRTTRLQQPRESLS
jgi:hypothetical protein